MERGPPAGAVYAYDAGVPRRDGATTVVFVHGAGEDHAVWALQSRYFAHHGYDVLAVDLPGHGRSGGAALATVEAMADWLDGFLAESSPARVALVGHSLGSLVALETAGRSPARIVRLALLGCAVPMPVADVLLDAAREHPPAAFDMINIWSHASALGGEPVPGVWQMGVTRRRLERTRPGTLAIDLAACHGYATGLAAAARVQCPTLLLCGERDQMTPVASSDSLLAALRSGRRRVVPGCGHSMMAERPDAILDELRAFLKTAS